MSRATKASVARNTPVDKAPPGSQGLHAMGYLAPKDACDYNQAIVAHMQSELPAWRQATAALTTEETLNAAIAGIDLNLKYRVSAWLDRLNESLSYRAEAFQPAFETVTLPVSIRHVIALEQSISAGVPFPTLNSTRASLRRLTDDLSPDASLGAIEGYKSALMAYQRAMGMELGGALGIEAGFNALDGD